MGSDNFDQLDKIARVLGTEGLIAYVKKYGAKPEQGCVHVLATKYTPKKWTPFYS